MTAVDVIVPKLGLTIESVEIAAWLVSVGDRVAVGDAMVEVNADKADVVVEAPSSGVVSECIAQAGDEVPLGAVIARIDTNAADDPEPAPPQATDGASAMPDVAPPMQAAPTPEDIRRDVATTAVQTGFPQDPTSTRRPTSPYARRLASRHSVALGEIAGTGPHGRVVARDVLAAVPAREAAQPPSGTDRRSWARATLLRPLGTDDVAGESRARLYLDCAVAVADALPSAKSRPVELAIHAGGRVEHQVVADWRDLSPSGLTRRLSLQGAEGITQDAGLTIHDLDGLLLDFLEPAPAPMPLIVLGHARSHVVLVPGPVPSLTTVQAIPFAIWLPGNDADAKAGQVVRALTETRLAPM